MELVNHHLRPRGGERVQMMLWEAQINNLLDKSHKIIISPQLLGPSVTNPILTNLLSDYVKKISPREQELLQTPIPCHHLGSKIARATSERVATNNTLQEFIECLLYKSQGHGYPPHCMGSPKPPKIRLDEICLILDHD